MLVVIYVHAPNILRLCNWINYRGILKPVNCQKHLCVLAKDNRVTVYQKTCVKVQTRPSTYTNHLGIMSKK